MAVFVLAADLPRVGTEALHAVVLGAATPGPDGAPPLATA